MKKRILAAILAAITMMSVAGCSSAKDSIDFSADEYMEAPSGGMASSDASMPEEAAGGYADKFESDYDSSGAAVEGVEGVEERKRIVYIDVTMETLEYDKTVSELKSMAGSAGGYIDSSEEYNSDVYGRGRSAKFVFRIPQADASGFAEALPSIGHVLTQSEHGSDVTAQYFDIETRLRSLELQRDKYMELLDKAEDINYIIELTQALSDVIYQIESYTTTLNRLDSLVAYSTVTVDVREVVEETKAPEEVTFGSRAAKAFSGSIEAFVAFVQWVAIAFVAASPFVMMLAVVVIVILVIVAIRRRKRR